MALTTYVSGEVLTAASLNDNFTFAAANTSRTRRTMASTSGLQQPIRASRNNTPHTIRSPIRRHLLRMATRSQTQQKPNGVQL
jgi:hypothetical protein